MKGKILYPLNSLKSKFPSLYRKEVEKYRGRESLLTINIPRLQCLWNDVIHLTAVHPKKIRNAFLKAGCQWHATEWFQIDPFSLDPSNTVVWLYTHEAVLRKDVIAYGPEKISKYTKIRKATTDYYKKQAMHNKRPLLFYRVPHILYKGELKVDTLPILRI